MSKDNPNIKAGKYETNIPENPTAEENRSRRKKKLGCITLAFIVVGLLLAAAIFTAIFVTKSGNINMGKNLSIYFF